MGSPPFRVAFVASAVVALLGALASRLLLRKVSGPLHAAVFSRRRRWFVGSTERVTLFAERVSPGVVIGPLPAGRSLRVRWVGAERCGM